MDPTLAGTAATMAVSTRMLRKALKGADDAALRWRAFPGANPMHWIAAHVTTVRSQLLALLGRPHPLPWSGYFLRGGTNVDEAQWPEIATIIAAWDAIAASLDARLAELTPEELAAPVQGALSFDGTVRGTIQLIAFHDAYHIGQLAYLRRQADLPRVAG